MRSGATQLQMIAQTLQRVTEFFIDQAGAKLIDILKMSIKSRWHYAHFAANLTK